MDDVTRENMPDDQAKPQDTQRGASEMEFTQFSQSARQPVEPNQHNTPMPPNSSNWESGNTVSAPPRARNPYAPPPVSPLATAQMAAYTTPQPTRPRTNILLVMAVIGLFGATILFSLGAFVVLRLANAQADLPAQTPSPAQVALAATPTVGAPAPTPTVGLDIQPWDGKHRFTILFMGLDKRPGEKGTAFRTDSMILFSIDPATKNVGILSVPRDLFVDIPQNTVVRNAYGLQRVNSAYVIGETVKAGYGPQLAMQTIQYNLGMRVNAYFVFEFNTVINAVDDIGGIDINVPTAIYDPAYPNMYYGYDPLSIPAGLIHMNGTLALKYGRTRHGSSDFDRAKRQQQVVMAVRDKILNLNLAPGLIAKAPELWKQFSDTTHSDLTFDQLLQLAVYLKDVPKENIHQGVVDINYVTPVNWQGADILVPERAKIGPLLKQVFGANYN